MQRAASARGLSLRPHAKTHKSPAIARQQIDRGAIGICCAKVGEAEVFAAEGIEDIRLPYPVHPSNASRVLRLMESTRLSIIVDHEAVARAWAQVMQRAARTLDVLVKVDVGFHRCGIDPSAPDAAGFVRRVGALDGLRLRGLLSHAGHVYLAGSEEELRKIAADEAKTLATLARESGIALEEMSVGATPTAKFSVGENNLTEIRPGNYAYFYWTQVGMGAARYEDCALTCSGARRVAAIPGPRDPRLREQDPQLGRRARVPADSRLRRSCSRIRSPASRTRAGSLSDSPRSMPPSGS